jgi:hypothetical protein
MFQGSASLKIAELQAGKGDQASLLLARRNVADALTALWSSNRIGGTRANREGGSAKADDRCDSGPLILERYDQYAHQLNRPRPQDAMPASQPVAKQSEMRGRQNISRVNRCETVGATSLVLQC